MKKKLLFLMSLCMLVLAALPVYAAAPKAPAMKPLTLDPVSKSLKIEWAAEEEAVSYKVYLKVDKDKKWTLVATTTETCVSNEMIAKIPKLAALKNASTYYVYVTAVNAAGEESTICGSGNSYTYVAAPKFTSLKSSGRKMTVRWKKVKGAKSIQVCYGPVLGKQKVVTVKGNKTVYQSKKLKKGTYYVVAVRTVASSNAGKLYSCWSPAKIVKIK